jgi:phosphoglycerate dehydrogenase-like enzyme
VLGQAEAAPLQGAIPIFSPSATGAQGIRGRRIAGCEILRGARARSLREAALVPPTTGIALTRVAIEPKGARGWLRDAVEAAGGTVVEPPDAQVLVWTTPTGGGELDAVLGANPGIEWVQLPWAGVEPVIDVVRRHPERTWTCGKGVYAEEVAEHAVALALAGLRGVAGYARASTWTAPVGSNLLGARVTVLGGGGITTSLLRLLEPFGCEVTVVRRHPEPMEGALRVLGAEAVDDALTGAELVVVALALTPETDGLLDARRLGLLAPGAWIVNVARGRHIVTDDLVHALARGRLGGAALDVTDPEPLPDDHPLWDLPNAIITPHVANTPEMAIPVLSRRVAENVRRWAEGEDLLGPVDLDLGY